MNVTRKFGHNEQKVVPFIRSGDYFFRQGIKAFRKNRLHRAIRLFERAVKMTAEEPVFQVQLASALSEAGEYERSNEILERVLAEHDEEIAECYFFMANNYAYLGLFERAEIAVLRYLELEPEDQFSEDAHDLLDLLHFEFEEEEWLEYSYSNEEEFISQHDRARQLLKKGEIELAISLLQKLIEAHPTNYAAKNHLAEAYFRLGDEEGAFVLCEDILQEDAGNLFAICNLALFHMRQGKMQKAMEYINRLKNVYPLDLDHHIKVAEVFCTVGEYEEASRRLKQLDRSEFERRPELYYCLAVAFIHLNNEEKAMNYMEKAAAHQYKKACHYVETGRIGSIAYDIWDE